MYGERGVIKNRDRQKQIHDFSGLKRRRNITPTDVDGLIDYSGKNFIYLEGKVAGNEIFYGQRLAIENMVKSHWDANHPSIAIIYEHWVPAHLDIDVSICKASKLFHKISDGSFKWEGLEDLSVLDIVDEFERQYHVT